MKRRAFLRRVCASVLTVVAGVYMPSSGVAGAEVFDLPESVRGKAFLREPDLRGLSKFYDPSSPGADDFVDVVMAVAPRTNRALGVRRGDGGMFFEGKIPAGFAQVVTGTRLTLRRCLVGKICRSQR